MIFRWWKRRRRNALKQAPVPREWHEILERNVTFFQRLSSSEQSKLLGFMQVFIAEKNWEGIAGVEMNEEIQVTIAAQAGLLTLGFEEEYFDLVTSVLVYPTDFVRPRDIPIGRVTLKGEVNLAGEAWYRGPVVLAWDEVLAGGRNEAGGDNLVLHEFAHQLDMHDGLVLEPRKFGATEESSAFAKVLTSEFEKLRRDCASGRYTLLDCYGAEDIMEFFAVATECFFMRPREMTAEAPELYQALRAYYRQDPARGF